MNNMLKNIWMRLNGKFVSLTNKDCNYHNPWAGLNSYEKPTQNEYNYLFCGRDKEIKELYTLINENLIVTLYGKSGIGKTSLINAGLTPVLEKQSYLPITIRLGEESREKDFAIYISEVIDNFFINNNSYFQCYKREKDIKEESYNPNETESKEIINETSSSPARISQEIVLSDTEYLLDYFAKREFYEMITDKDGIEERRIVFPVIILDQFEEIFRKWKNRAQHLLLQINELTTDYYKGKEVVTNYRFLLSIREDDLYLLEEGLDENYIMSMKRNRFRLRRLDDNMAKEVIIKPGAAYIDSESKDEIVNNIIQASRGQDDRVSSLLLSLICSRLFEEASRNVSGDNQPIITLKMTDNISNNYLQKFYVEIVEKLQLSKIQQKTLDSLERGGRRESIPITNFRKVFDDALLKKLTKGEYSILRILSDENSEDRIELIHDSFCSIIENQKKDRNQSTQIITSYLVLIPLFLLIMYLDKEIYPYSIAHEGHMSGWAEKMCHIFHLYGLYSFYIYSVIFLSFLRREKVSFSHMLMCAVWSILPICYEYVLNKVSDMYTTGYYSTYGLYSLPRGVYVSCFFISLIIIVIWIYTNYINKETKTIPNQFNSSTINTCLLCALTVMSYYKICCSPSEGIDYYHMRNSWVFPFTASIAFFQIFYKDNKGWFFFPFIYMIIGYILFDIEEFDNQGSFFIKIPLILIFLFFIYYSLLNKRYISRKKSIIISCVNLIMFLSVVIFYLGYNPYVISESVDPNDQQGIWKWKTIIVKDKDTGKSFLLNANNGRRMLPASAPYDSNDNTFQYFGNFNDYYGYLLKAENHILYYRYCSKFEFNHFHRVKDGDSISLLLDNARTVLLNINSSEATSVKWNVDINTFNEYNDIIKLKENLLSKEEKTNITTNDRKVFYNIVKYGNENTQGISCLLCKCISNIWLKTAFSTDDINQKISAFDTFVSIHYPLEISINEKTIDWDSMFEQMCREINIELSYPEEILTTLLFFYNKSDIDYGLRSILYHKIKRLKKLKDYNIDYIPTPFNV